jgi:hypothetical protein
MAAAFNLTIYLGTYFESALANCFKRFFFMFCKFFCNTFLLLVGPPCLYLSKKLSNKTGNEKKNVYESWPFANCFSDKSTGDICAAINEREKHADTNNTGTVWFRKKK